jgi:hypothetical protein
MIPVRIPAYARPVLASERVIDLAPTHPLALSEVPCPVCDGPLAGTKVVLVFVGIAPEDRKSAGWTTGAAVTVHEACSASGPWKGETEPARLTREAIDGFDAMTRAQDGPQ